MKYPEYSLELWQNTYKGPEDNSVEDTINRQALACSSIEKEEIREQVYKDFLWLLSDHKGIAGGRITANLGVLGREATTLMNCFTHNPRDIGLKDPDSIRGIYTLLEAQAQTLKSEGGYGTNFSYIRPAGSYVKGIDGRTPGVLKFMEMWDKSSEIITMGSESLLGERRKSEKAKIRKGAQMGILNCLSGETLVSTLSGKIKLKDLVDKNPLVYCTDGKGNIFIRKASEVWSNGFKETVKIKFDNDDDIICTPDHKIMLSDGSYKEAKDLSFGDSVAVLSKKLYNKYYNIGVTGYRKLTAEHIAVAEYKYGRYPIVKMNDKAFASDSEDVHHIDFNSLNNDPDNLEILTREEHYKKHYDLNCLLLAKYRDQIAKDRKGKTHKEYYGEEKATKVSKKRVETWKKNGGKPWNFGLETSEYKKHYSDGFKNQFNKKIADETNHKVVSVTPFETIEVFDMSVPDYHNFVANGVFVHNCNHPEIYDFIDAKLTPGRLTKFNLSVGITNGFMEAVLADAPWELKFPDTDHALYSDRWSGDIEDWEELGLPVIVHKVVKARELWNKIMHATYTRNDPGVVFLDLANKFNPLDYAEKILQTNPCGEIQMPTGVCLLFSLNLVKFIKNNEFDYETFAKAVTIATRFADNINDISRVPLPEYKHSMLSKRRIGLGVLGLGSLHYMLGIKFGSRDSTVLIESIFKAKCEAEILASAKLGQEKSSFPLFDREKHFNTLWWKTLPISNDVKRQVEEIGCMRNSHHAANAPTGNMSIYAGLVSGGIEPVFMKEYARWSIVPEFDRYDLRKAGLKFPDISKGEWFETEHFKLSKAGTDDVLLGKFNDVEYQVDKNRGLTKRTIVEDYGYSWCKENLSKDQFEQYERDGVFCTTEDLTVEAHVNSLTALAKFVNMNSSKTVNLPNEYKYEDFKDLYMSAWKNGIKGITSYRAGTMTAVLEAVNVKKEEKPTREELLVRDAPKRAKVLNSQTHKVRLDNGDGVQNAYITVSFFPQTSSPYEVFINTIGNNLKDLQIIELSARMTSLALRHGVPVKYIAEQLNKIDGQYIYSIPNNLSKILSNYIDDDVVEAEVEVESEPEAIKTVEFKTKSVMGKCSVCGERSLIKEEGCEKCLSCSYSKCS